MEVPASYRARRPPGVTIHAREAGGYREIAESRVFPSWTAAEIHAALSGERLSKETHRVLERVGWRLDVQEGTEPDDGPLLSSTISLLSVKSCAKWRRIVHGSWIPAFAGIQEVRLRLCRVGLAVLQDNSQEGGAQARARSNHESPSNRNGTRRSAGQTLCGQRAIDPSRCAGTWNRRPPLMYLHGRCIGQNGDSSSCPAYDESRRWTRRHPTARTSTSTASSVSSRSTGGVRTGLRPHLSSDSDSSTSPAPVSTIIRMCSVSIPTDSTTGPSMAAVGAAA